MSRSIVLCCDVNRLTVTSCRHASRLMSPRLTLNSNRTFSLNGVDELVDVVAGGSSSFSDGRLLLLPSLLDLIVLAAELVEEVGEEAEHSHVGRSDSLHGVVILGDGLDDVAWHQEAQEDPAHDEEANDDGKGAASSISKCLSVTGKD